MLKVDSCFQVNNVTQILMMNSSEIDDPNERQRLRNKKRLLNQNIKLNQQISQLERQMNEILAIRENQLNPPQQNYESIKKVKEEIVLQDKYIKKLKARIDFLKSANVKGNAEFIVREEDLLKIVKKQYEDLLLQKQTVIRFREDKEKHLERNGPFKQHKESIEGNLAEVRKENRVKQAKIVELEREVRKYHNFIVLNTTLSRQKLQTSSLQYEIAQTDHEIKQVVGKSKEIEQKWKPQLQGLDKQLFDLRNSSTREQKKLQEVERECKQWEIRALSLREEGEIVQFKERLSKVNLLPEQKKFAYITSKKTPSRVWKHKSIELKQENQKQQSEKKEQSEAEKAEQKKDSIEISEQKITKQGEKTIQKGSEKSKANQSKKNSKKETKNSKEEKQKSKDKNVVPPETNGKTASPQKKNAKEKGTIDKVATDKGNSKTTQNKKKGDQKMGGKDESKSENGLDKSVDKKKESMGKGKSQKKVSFAEQSNKTQKNAKGKEESPKGENTSKKKQKQFKEGNKKQIKLLLKSVGVGP